ncbi:SRPBCC family protein [Antrihabitans cavernicola]|uniref:Dimethyladenosine transferase n=1 Tax=Antrihabitans cavernicola TaxID=2495913 RepID=A0A5A7SBU3_9NOCA|nr:SRPBCC family protein [Spelaeibacter cavernicola]KAA0021701.1 dimethyladenosine transferase [Spelaeibacter cavernicola]
MTADQNLVTVQRTIAAPPDAIFALLVDPRRHREFDGSGAVRSPKGASTPLTLGSRFGMSMYAGVPYSMVSTVVEFELDRTIAWQTNGPTAFGKFVAGRIWRYRLEPVAGGTAVSETWDISQESRLTKPIIRGQGPQRAKDMAATLERIESIVTR